MVKARNQSRERNSKVDQKIHMVRQRLGESSGQRHLWSCGPGVLGRQELNLEQIRVRMIDTLKNKFGK